MEKVQVFKRKDGQFDWRLLGLNGEEVCGSLQGYTERNDAEEAFQRAAGLMHSIDLSGFVAEYIDESGGPDRDESHDDSYPMGDDS
jgi:uncharacterized protein YegP (UPF0339 family)